MWSEAISMVLMLTMFLFSPGMNGCVPKGVVQANELLSGLCTDGAQPGAIPVGVLLPLSGMFQMYGDAALKGIQLILDGDGTQDGSGISGKLTLIIRDTAGDPDQAARMVEELAVKEKVSAIIGPMFTQEAKEAASRAQELAVPILTLSGAPDITQTGSYVFRNFLTRAAQAKRLVDYAVTKLGVKKFATLYPDDHDGNAFLDAFRVEVERHGAELALAEVYPPETTDFNVVIRKMVARDKPGGKDYAAEHKKILAQYKNEPVLRKRALEKLRKNAKPTVRFDALFVPDTYEKIAMIAPALAFNDVAVRGSNPEQLQRMKKTLGRAEVDTVYLLGGEGFNHPKLLEWAARYVEGAIFCDGFFVQSQRKATQQFASLFRKQYQKDPDMLSAYGYDAALFLSTVLEKTRPCSRDQLRDGLLKWTEFDGATGPAVFPEDRDARKDLFLLTILNGAIVELEKPAMVSLAKRAATITPWRIP